MNFTLKNLTLAVTALTLLLFNPSSKATSEILSFSGNEVNSKTINLKQDKTQNHQKTFIGNWDALSTLKDPQGQTVSTITGLVTYNKDNSYQAQFEMKMYDGMDQKVLAVINLELDGLWSIKDNILTERLKEIKVVSVKSNTPGVESSQLKNLLQQELNKDIDQPSSSQITDINQQKIILKNETSGGIFTLTRKL
jgi:hypothetical protein